MKYQYKCKECIITKTIEKPISQCARDEYCNECEKLMQRVYSVSSIKTSDGIKV